MPKLIYRLRTDAIHELNKYVDHIVNPTLDEFQHDLLNPRRAFIACVVTAHCIDRITNQPSHARQIWKQLCTEFALVDYVCNTTKHVSADNVRAPKKKNVIPMRALLPMGLNDTVVGSSGMHPHNVHAACRTVVRFAQHEIVRIIGLDENDFD